VLSHSLDKSDFMDAMRSRSFYVSHSCTAMLDFNVSGETMGTVMEHAYEPAFVVSIEDVSSSQTPGIKIYKGTNDGSTYTDNNLADGASAYYFTDVSIGSSRTISSPVWYHRNDHMTNAINPVSSIKQSSQIDILENPVKGQILQYQLKDGNDGIKGTVFITDIYGRQIFSESIVMNDRVRSIILSAFPAGTYLLQVNSAKGRYHAKFVKY
jgi:hypothetical protein